MSVHLLGPSRAEPTGAVDRENTRRRGGAEIVGPRWALGTERRGPGEVAETQPDSDRRRQIVGRV